MIPVERMIAHRKKYEYNRILAQYNDLMKKIKNTEKRQSNEIRGYRRKANAIGRQLYF